MMREAGTRKGGSQCLFPYVHHCVVAVEANLGLWVPYINASGALIRWDLAVRGMRSQGMYLTQEAIG